MSETKNSDDNTYIFLHVQVEKEPQEMDVENNIPRERLISRHFKPSLGVPLPIQRNRLLSMAKQLHLKP